MQLDLDTELKKDGPIYVLNTTSPKGKVICTFTDSGGKNSKPLNVPKTWIPIKVSAAIPKELIGASLDFRAHLAKGVLTLIDAKEAEKILDSEDAKEELKNLNRSEFATNPKFAGQAAKDLISAYDARAEVSKEEAANLKINDEEDYAMRITPAVLDISTRFNTKDLDTKTALNELRCIQEDLTSEDCHYIIANMDGQVRGWAKERLELLLNTEPVVQQQHQAHL